MSEIDDLFPDAPIPKARSMLEHNAAPAAKLSATQRAFRQHVANIEAAQLRLKETAELLNTYRPIFQNKTRPLCDQHDRLNRDMVVFLDQQLLTKKWTPTQRKTMEDIVCQIAEMLFGSPFHDEMEEIVDRRRGITAAEVDAAADALGAAIEAMLGKDGSSANEALRRSQELFEADVAQHDERAAAHAAKKQRGKKSARQIKAEQQEVDAGKMLKDIYRKLTSALHPDRETDEAERARKNALMSEANKAYESKNLLALLQLQLKNNQFDASTAATMADDKLKLINHSLKRQLDDLQRESYELEMMVRDVFQLSHYGKLDAQALQKSIARLVAALKADIKNMQLDLRNIKEGDAPFKAWLKEQRKMMREGTEFDDVIDFVMMEPLKKRR
jgi:hypothetical protein